MWKLSLDAAQEELIARLEASRSASGARPELNQN
jgi:hypothetical protein